MVVYRESLTKENSDIFAASLSGTLQWLRAQWSDMIEEPELVCSLTDRYGSDKKTYEMGGFDKDEAFPLPNCDLVIVAIEPKTSGYNRFVMERMGIVTGSHLNKGMYRAEHLVPIEVGIGVQFEGSNSSEAHAFGQMWQRAGPNSGFVIRQNHTNARFHIQLSLDPSVQIPQRGENEQGTLIVETTLIVSTYTGSSVIRPTVKDIRIGMATPLPDDKWTMETVQIDTIRSHKNGR